MPDHLLSQSSSAFCGRVVGLLLVWHFLPGFVLFCPPPPVRTSSRGTCPLRGHSDIWPINPQSAGAWTEVQPLLAFHVLVSRAMSSMNRNPKLSPSKRGETSHRTCHKYRRSPSSRTISICSTGTHRRFLSPQSSRWSFILMTEVQIPHTRSPFSILHLHESVIAHCSPAEAPVKLKACPSVQWPAQCAHLDATQGPVRRTLSRRSSTVS